MTTELTPETQRPLGQEELVPLQIPVRKRTRQRLRIAAVDAELTMAVLGDFLIQHGLDMLGGATPGGESLRAALARRQAADSRPAAGDKS